MQDQPPRAAVTWLGHSSVLVEMAGEGILVDPLGRRRCRDVGPYHTVLITHAHHDHLNRWTLVTLDRSARLVVPVGARALVADLGFSSVCEVEPGDHLSRGHLDVVAVATRHAPGRLRRGDGPTCIGYVISRGGVAVHHAGDVDMSDFTVFDDIGRSFTLDATLLPIGGMLPVFYYRLRRRAVDRRVHIDPDTALDLALRLRAKVMVPIHWGTFNLPFTWANAPRRRLQKVAAARNATPLLRVLEPGQTLSLV